VLVLLLVLSIQTTLFKELRPFGVAGQVILLFVICAGIQFGTSIGAIVGLVAGLMFDFVVSTPAGLGSIALGVTGATAGLYLYFFPSPIWWLRMISIAIVSVFGEMYLLIAQAMVGLGVVLELRLLTIIAVVTTINIVLSPGFFLITRWTLSERKKES
jgi:rod shape-determining protein MreD